MRGYKHRAGKAASMILVVVAAIMVVVVVGQCMLQTWGDFYKAFFSKNSRFCAFSKVCASFQVLYDSIIFELPTSKLEL